MLPNPDTVGNFIDFEFCPYEIITSSDVHMIQPLSGKTLREHIKAKVAAAPKEMSSLMEISLQSSASSRTLSPSPSPVRDIGHGDGWISRDESDVDGEGNYGPGDDSNSTDSSYSGSLKGSSAGLPSDEEEDMPASGDDSDSMPHRRSGPGSNTAQPNTKPASKVVKKNQNTGADPTVITMELTARLRILSSKNVHSPSNPDKSTSYKLRKVEKEGFKMCLKSDELDQICEEANSLTTGKLQAPCFLCSSDIHKVLPGRNRHPDYPNHHTIGDKPLKILQHIQNHHQHDVVKAMYLCNMLERISWLSKLSNISHTTCDI